MPAYGAPPLGSSAGYGSAIWNDELVTVGTCSIPVSMHRNANLPNCVSIELLFAADPGAFSIELQTADTDQNKYYVPKTAAITTGLNADFVGRIEASNIIAKYLRLKLVSRTNAVHLTAKVF